MNLVEDGSMYSAQFIVMDSSSNVLAVFSGLDYTTVTKEEPYCLEVNEISHSSAHVWWEEIVEEGGFLFTRK